MDCACHQMSHWYCACHATSQCNVTFPAPATKSHAPTLPHITFTWRKCLKVNIYELRKEWSCLKNGQQSGHMLDATMDCACHQMSHWYCACHATSQCNVTFPAPATKSHAPTLPHITFTWRKCLKVKKKTNYARNESACRMANRVEFSTDLLWKERVWNKWTGKWTNELRYSMDNTMWILFRAHNEQYVLSESF